MIAAELARRAAVLAAEGEREGAGWALYRAATLCADDDPAQALVYLDDAFAVIVGLEPWRLLGSIALLAAELAYDAGDAQAGANASVEAERAFRQAPDPRGFLAVWVARAVRALREGDGDAGVLMVRWMLPWLDQVAEPAPRIWLRLFGADWLASDGQVASAVTWLAEALELAAPGSPEFLLAAERLVTAFLGLERPIDAARVAAAALDSPIGAPPTLRAEIYRGLAEGLRQSAPGPLADYCDLIAVALDDDDDAPAVPSTAPPPRDVVSSLLR